MKTEHTPGPWVDKQLPDRGPIYIEAHPDFNRGHNIAKCFGPEREANARLIAAAPDLLAALDEMHALFADHAQYDDSEEQHEAKAIEAARAAIAKATQA